MDRGVFLPGNTLHQECLWFCFAELIQQDLDFVKIHWNTHYIGQSIIIIIIIITLFKCQCIFSTAVLIGDTVNKETNMCSGNFSLFPLLWHNRIAVTFSVLCNC